MTVRDLIRSACEMGMEFRRDRDAYDSRVQYWHLWDRAVYELRVQVWHYLDSGAWIVQIGTRLGNETTVVEMRNPRIDRIVAALAMLGWDIRETP